MQVRLLVLVRVLVPHLLRQWRCEDLLHVRTSREDLCREDLLPTSLPSPSLTPSFFRRQRFGLLVTLRRRFGQMQCAKDEEVLAAMRRIDCWSELNRRIVILK